MQNSKLNRRSLMALFGATGTAVAAPAIAAAMPDHASPTDRMVYHLAEYQKAAEALYPSICGWKMNQGIDPDGEEVTVIEISATRKLPPKPPKFHGDGAYLIAFWPNQKPSKAMISVAHGKVFDGQQMFNIVIETRDGEGYVVQATEEKTEELIIGKLGGVLA